MFQDILHAFPNPAAPFEVPGRSTLHLVAVDRMSDWTIIQEFRDKSVLAGVSALGGLMSVFTGIFVMLFGITIIGVIYRECIVPQPHGSRRNADSCASLRLHVGVKPIGLFGLAHSVAQSQQTSIAQGCFDKYPALQQELEEIKRNPGLMALLLDSLINIEMLQQAKVEKQREAKSFHSVRVEDEQGRTMLL